MSNSVTERIPYDWFEIDAIEGWLDEHVQQGLRLVSISGFGRALFVPSTGTLTRYRIHVKPERGISHDDEYRATFADLGWEYVDSINAQADVYQAVRPDAVEINTDEEVLRSVIDRVVRNRRIGLFALCALILYWCYQQFQISHLDAYAGPYDYLLSNGIFLLFDLLLLSAWTVLVIAGFKRLRNVKKRYLLQREHHTAAEIKRRKRPEKYLLIACSTIILGCLVLFAFFNGNDNERIENNPCPVTDLSVINPEEYANLQPHDIWAHSGSYLLYDYTTYRRDAESVETPANWSYTPYHYVVHLRDIRITAWVEPYLREALAFETDQPWQQVDISGWDEAWYCAYQMTYAEAYAWTKLDLTGIEGLPPFRQQHLYLRDGSTIIHVNYNGATDLYPRLQELYGR